MAPTGLQRWLPQAPTALIRLLDSARGPVEPPIRSEIFGLQRMAQHGHSLAETHRAARTTWRTPGFAPRLRSNIRALREAHAYIGLQAATGYDVSPAAEWLLDNFHLIEAQLETISAALPRRYFRSLPVLVDEPLAGLPRIYGVAWAFVAHTDGAFDDELLTHFLGAYQDARELRLSEMWALPTVLRVVLIENLRRLAERVATNKAAREAANLCADRLDAYNLHSLGEFLAFMNQRGVGRVFLVQMAQRLESRRGEAFDAHHRWLREALPDLDPLRIQQAADQAADNLSVSNAVNSLRSISDADWPDVIARSSVVMRLMLTSPGFAAEHQVTRDLTLHGIELLATRSGRSELAVAQSLLDLMSGGRADDPASNNAHYWLQGAGRVELRRGNGLSGHAALGWQGIASGVRFPVYLATLVLGTVALMAWLLMRHGTGTAGMSGGWGWVGAILMALPASETVVAVVNRIISESARPVHVPRLALAGGIPPEHRTMVVIPGLLFDAGAGRQLAHRLQLHYLANPEPNVQFALLTDWADAATERVDADADVLAAASQEILELNARHPGSPDGAARFILLHRSRRFSPTEQCWIGWERKRGKLEELVAALAEGSSAAFAELGEVSRIATQTRYIVTLDSDTHLPPGRLRELVAVAAHPDNEPRLDAAGGVVVSGYGILQPRIVTPLPSPRAITPYHWLFAGQCGVDPYSAATSEIYQDVFREGSFTGKGLLHVKAMHAVLHGRLPEGLVLSHDLLEGSLARCAAVTDITLIEDAPFHAEVAAARLHRWMRGDWQLLPFLLQPSRFRLRAINRWKMFDNLRRSLVAPGALAFLVLALSGLTVSPWAALLLVIAAFSGGPLMGAIAAFVPARHDLAGLHFLRRASIELARAASGGLWHLAQLLQQAVTAADAVLRATYRMSVSHRHLLQWTTAAAVQARTSTGLQAVLRQHWTMPWLALLLLAGLLAAGTPSAALASVLCLLWAGSPIWTWWVSRAPRRGAQAVLTDDEQFALECTARDAWRLFERCVDADDHHLPPDNLQTLPHDAVAHRTSPTNIGLYLLSVACAREFGWIGTEDLLQRLEATLATLATMPRHRGHLLNWYDTQTLEPLRPSYVSTVDSGNLSGHLLAVGQACLERARAPYGDRAGVEAIARSARRLSWLLARLPHPPPAQPDCAPLARLLSMSCPAAEGQADAASYRRLLDRVAMQWAQVPAPDVVPGASTRPTLHEELAWCVADHAAAVRSAWRDATARAAGDASGVPAALSAARRLQSLALACERMAWEPDFRFLYHRKRHLFHIGYRVAEQQLDTGFYDLLASESRLTSLLAIAKGDVPAAHWAALGRPFFAVGAIAGLRSWSGSMFEYLMPTLVLDEPQGSVLRDACRAALREQIDFARAHGVPWGISESAYAGRDHTLAYQYAPQGVPRLALRRTPPQELVVAPYATALAAQIAPDVAAANMLALKALAAYARYGFIEALDFSPVRQTGLDACTPVVTFMAHHQGMSIVALANVLLDGAAQRWGMANPHIEAAASLLHEQPPREVGRLRATPIGPPPQGLRQRAPGLLRELVPGATALAPTHLLSNGRYSVALRPHGGGWSRWGSLDITRWRDDALRDGWGSFLYVRGDLLPRMVSLTSHPAPDPVARYTCTYHADRVCFDAAWPALLARTTVWVSPEDDIEFRQVELHNPGEESIEIELLSAFEVALSDARADEAHPAFMNLFVRARWDAEQQAILWQRVPRLATERGLQAAHFLAESDAQVLGVRLQTDRQRWRGRQQPSDRLMAALDDMPDAAGTGDLDTGLDPVSVLAVRVRIAPNAKAQLTFATAASEDEALLRAIVDKYRQVSHVQRASLMSATLTGIRFRSLGIGPENLMAVQALTTAVVLSLTRPQRERSRVEDAAIDTSDRRLLWRFGISGDRPLILVTAGVMQGLGLLRSLAQALRLWSWGGVPCDLVVINAEPASYDMGLQREITALRERHGAEARAQSSASVTGFHLLRADEITREELGTLRGVARIHLQADGRPLSHHVAAWGDLHEVAREERPGTLAVAVGVAARALDAESASVGAFSAEGREFTFDVGRRRRPPRPWINLLANREFGAQLSEAGGGYTWARNSRLHQLTAWSNDPVADPPSEWFLLQDRRTQQAWSVAPSAWGDESVTYRVSHGQGYSVIRHRRGDLEVTALWCVDRDLSVKQVRLQLTNHGARILQLRLVGIAEWMMGAYRTDRNTVTTAHARQPIVVPDPGALPRVPRGGFVTVLLCSQREHSAGFGDGTAFLAVEARADESQDWTCDRRECFDAEGRMVLPDQWGQRSGSGLDPCAVLSIDLALPAGERTERVFLLGHAESATAALRLAAQAAAVPGALRHDQVRRRWDELLGATTVKTPDPLFDAMVNRWLLYQTVACRMWAKAGFYQAGGATGFRDQLQDAMALAWAAPEMLREQILLAASRQFVEGDVQHWWHSPGGAGVRTRFSDDLLWLPHACVHYLHATGDFSLLDRRVTFLEGPPLPDGAEDVYDVPAVSAHEESVYEHAARTIDRSLATGVHGLPLIGTGDWNDGMNRVGHEGRGESVWLAWFLCRLVEDFAPLALERGESARARRWQRAAEGWRRALEGCAWDGQWFVRAFFDDGQPLGSRANPEAQIDLIAQAWAVLSGAATEDRQRIAMASAHSRLVDPEAGLIRLLDPPLAHASPNAGYIQAYPPGVRENGGQYSHAGVWALMAQAELATRAGAPADDCNLAYRYFTYLSPAHRASHPERGAVYGIEPYAMAGDVYSQPPCVGRGGWSWYTGAAAWMHRAAIESIFGLRHGARELSLRPCLPSHWPRAELTLQRDGRTMQFILLRTDETAALAATAAGRSRLLRYGQSVAWTELPSHTSFVMSIR